MFLILFNEIFYGSICINYNIVFYQFQSHDDVRQLRGAQQWKKSRLKIKTSNSNLKFMINWIFPFVRVPARRENKPGDV